MNDQFLNQNQNTVKPCIKCGATDRYVNGYCKPCARRRASEYRNKNLDIIKQKDRKRRIITKDKDNANAKRWRLNNKERLHHLVKEWKKNNPDRYKQIYTRSAHNRRVRTSGGGKLSKDIINKLMALQNGKCACCGASLKGGYHLDHIIPLALGGGNVDNNVQLLTPKCNLSKGAKHPISYMQSKGLLL